MNGAYIETTNLVVGLNRELFRIRSGDPNDPMTKALKYVRPSDEEGGDQENGGVHNSPSSPQDGEELTG